MYQFYPPYQTQQQFPSWYNQPYLPPPPPLIAAASSTTANLQYSIPSTNWIPPPQSNPNEDPRALSDSELTNLLDKHTDVLKQLHAKDQQKQLPIFLDAIGVLIRIPKSILVSNVQNEFFSLLRSPLTDILQQWSQLSSLSEDEFFMFRAMTKLIRRLIKAADDVRLLPLWLTDATLLEAISNCLTNIATSGSLLHLNHKSQFKYFTRLIDAYILYQQQLNDQNSPNKDLLVQLLDPILQCLASPQFTQTFAHLPTDIRSMTAIEKFFLVKCPAFFTSYNGSRLEQTVKSLLSIMLPQYAQLLDQLILSIHQWERAMLRSVHHLLQMINHGANQFQTNAKLVSSHLSLIDDALKIVNEPTLYNNLRGTPSNLETILMNTAISFLVNMISEPSILAHIKQSQVTGGFLRLTMCLYEPLVFNVYALLAYTTHEEDIKAMHNPGRLFATIIKSLKITMKETQNNKSQREQLLETLKGLVQHEQMKDEVIKQNALPFLLECMNKLTDRAQILILETLWSLTFREENALALRSNDRFLNKIQTISLDSKNEPLKKAADGLVWKLIREPAFLKKLAKQEEDERNAAKEVLQTIVEEVVNIDGQRQLVTTTKPVANSPEERTFEYDIMISYCHADKELTYKIHKVLLDQGFKIWIDLDNMYGPAMNAMAEAVENSEFVIMCMSDSYKQSTYCQAEAEYAFNCKRRLIPLIMRPGYRPDGWLGFMIGSRIYVDFGRFDFEIACEKLLNELSLQRKQPLTAKPVQISVHESPTKIDSKKHRVHHRTHRRERSAAPKTYLTLSIYSKRKPSSNFTRKPVTQWTDADVLDFLYTQHFIQLMPLCDGMDGHALIQLYKMCLSRSSKTYSLLDDELQSTYQMKLPIGIYTRFIGAMEQRLTTRSLAPSQMKPALLTVPALLPRTTTTTISALPLPKTTTSATTTTIVVPVTTTTPAVTKLAQKYVPPLIKPSVVQNIPYQYSSYVDKPSIMNNFPYQYPSYSHEPYDLLITSDAPALTVLKAVSHCGLNVEKMSSCLANHLNRY